MTTSHEADAKTATILLSSQAVLEWTGADAMTVVRDAIRATWEACKAAERERREEIVTGVDRVWAARVRRVHWN